MSKTLTNQSILQEGKVEFESSLNKSKESIVSLIVLVIILISIIVSLSVTYFAKQFTNMEIELLKSQIKQLQDISNEMYEVTMNLQVQINDLRINDSSIYEQLDNTWEVISFTQTDINEQIVEIKNSLEFKEWTERSNIRIDLTDEEIELLCDLVFAEASVMSFKGKSMISSVVINRVLSDEFPDNLHDVVYQKNAFSVVNDGSLGDYDMNDEYTKMVYEKTKEAVVLSLVQDTSNGALYFLNVDLCYEQGYGHNAEHMLNSFDEVCEVDNVTFLN